LGRLERLRLEAHRGEEPRERFTHRLIIVDDEDDLVLDAHGLKRTIA